MKILLLALAFAFFAVIGGAAAAPSDGEWVVRLPPTGSASCPRDWIARLIVAEGQLSGAFQYKGMPLGILGTQTIEPRLETRRKFYGDYIWLAINPLELAPLAEIFGVREVFGKHSYHNRHCQQ